MGGEIEGRWRNVGGDSSICSTLSFPEPGGGRKRRKRRRMEKDGQSADGMNSEDKQIKIGTDRATPAGQQIQVCVYVSVCVCAHACMLSGLLVSILSANSSGTYVTAVDTQCFF